MMLPAGADPCDYAQHMLTQIIAGAVRLPARLRRPRTRPDPDGQPQAVAQTYNPLVEAARGARCPLLG